VNSLHSITEKVSLEFLYLFFPIEISRMKFTYFPPTQIDTSKEDQFLFYKETNKWNEENIVVYNTRLTSFLFSLEPTCFNTENGWQEVSVRLDGTKIPSSSHYIGNSSVSVNFDIGSTMTRVSVRSDLFMFEVFLSLK
jgi:hypothetical protein